MNDQELRESPFPVTWDNTMRQLAASCPRKLYLFLRGFDYERESRPSYFVWGSAWGEILATWYSNPPEVLANPQSPEYVSASFHALEAGLALWDTASPEEKGPNKRSSLALIWDAYLAEYPVEPFELVEKGAEAGWVYPLKDTPYYLGGAYDLTVAQQGKIFCLEDKTDGGYLSDNYCQGWFFSPQITGYIWYLTKILGRERAGGCLMNLVTKNVPGPRSKWTTPRFKRFLVTKSAAQLNSFELHAIFTIEAFRQLHWSSWYWPPALDPSNCSGGIGRSPCLFRSACLAGADPTQLSPSDIPHCTERIGPWEPWKRSGSETVPTEEA